MAKGLAKYVHYNKVLLYQGSFLYILLLLAKRNRSLYRGLCYIELCYVKVPLYSNLEYCITVKQGEAYPPSLHSFLMNLLFES